MSEPETELKPVAWLMKTRMGNIAWATWQPAGEPLVRLSDAEARIAELQRERDAFRGVLEGAEYGDIESIAQYDADKARALGRMVGDLSKGIRIQLAVAEARAEAAEALLKEAKTALEPFAAIIEEYDPWKEGDDVHGTLVIGSVTDYSLTLGHLRAARAISDKVGGKG